MIEASDDQDSTPRGEVFRSADGGGTWTQQAFPAGGGALSDVSCFGTTTCTAVGGTFIQHTTTGGTSWVTQQAPSGVSSLDAVDCASADDCMAVGTSTDGMPLVVATRNGGTTWTAVSVPSQVSSLSSVSCWSTTACFVAGKYYNPSSHTYDGVVRHTSNLGSSWTVPTTSSSIYSLAAISCPVAGSCIAVGQGQPTTSSTTPPAAITFSAGIGWKAVSLPATNAPLVGVSCSAAGVCSAIASDSIVSTSNNGASWTSAAGPTGTSVALRTVSCPAAGTCVVAGFTYTYPLASGLISDTLNGGSTWTNATVPPALKVASGVDCTTTTFCGAVGSGTSGIGGVIVTSTSAFS